MPLAPSPCVPTHVVTLNRRCHVRRAPRGGVHVECRIGTLGLGRNLAVSLLDLSTRGAGVILTKNLAKNQEVELSLNMLCGLTVKIIAEVKWTQPLMIGLYRVGLEFRRPLEYADLARMT